MNPDHRTAAGLFPKLVRFRAEQLRGFPPIRNRRRKGAAAYDERVLEFKQACPGPGVRVAIFGGSGSGAFVSSERVTFLVQERQIRFPWTEAQKLLHRADAIAWQAAEWWPREEIPPTASRRKRKRAETNDAERRPHLDRAYEAMTALLSAIDQENRRTPKRGRPSEACSAIYKENISVLAADLDRAEKLLDGAAQREAQTSYTEGMLIGGLGLGLLCALIGVALAAADKPAADAVALLSGGLGAIVSVLQRITSAKLRLDTQAGRKMMFRFGALRPWIGAVLGMAVFSLIAGGVVSFVAIPLDDQLAFYASLGFLAGFNERFAQDVIAGSDQLMTR
jgi:hypothetical protein